MLLGIDAPPAAVQEARRQLGLHEDVLREMTLRVEAIDEAPSAILSRRSDERDRDRGFRGPRPAGRFSSGRGRERERRARGIPRPPARRDRTVAAPAAAEEQ